MTKIVLEIHDNVLSTILKLKNINDQGIELEIPEGSILFDNILNLKLINKEAEKLNMTVHFYTKDPIGNNLLLALDETPETVGSMETLEDNPDQEIIRGHEEPIKKFTFPKIKFNFPMHKSAGPLILGLIIALAIFGASVFLTRSQKATAEIKVNSQQLGRSVTVHISSNETPAGTEKEYLKGTTITTNLEASKEIETTGEKMVGEKAKGDVKIYNNTDDEKKFKKDTILIYEKDDEEYRFLLTEDVTIDARAEITADPLQPELVTYKKGEEIVSVIAEAIGDKYNIKEASSLTIKDQKTSSFSAKTDQDFKGGKSEKVKVVTAEDKTKLKNELLSQLEDSTEKELLKKVGKDQELIKGSYKTTILSESFTNDVDAETEKVSLTLSVKVEALVYLKDSLTDLVTNLIKGMIPNGFVLTEKDTTEIKTDVLGNSSNSILSSTEADLQVTAKTYIVTALDEDKIKQDMAGKTLGEAEKILGSIRDVKTYKLTISPNIPLFNKLPKDPKQIEIIVEKD